MIAPSPAYEAAADRVFDFDRMSRVLPSAGPWKAPARGVPRFALSFCPRRPLCLTAAWTSPPSMLTARWSVVVLPAGDRLTDALILRDGTLVARALWSAEYQRLYAPLGAGILDPDDFGSHPVDTLILARLTAALRSELESQALIRALQKSLDVGCVS